MLTGGDSETRRPHLAFQSVGVGAGRIRRSECHSSSTPIGWSWVSLGVAHGLRIGLGSHWGARWARTGTSSALLSHHRPACLQPLLLASRIPRWHWSSASWWLLSLLSSSLLPVLVIRHGPGEGREVRFVVAVACVMTRRRHGVRAVGGKSGARCTVHVVAVVAACLTARCRYQQGVYRREFKPPGGGNRKPVHYTEHHVLTVDAFVVVSRARRPWPRPLCAVGRCRQICYVTSGEGADTMTLMVGFYRRLLCFAGCVGQ